MPDFNPDVYPTTLPIDAKEAMIPSPPHVRKITNFADKEETVSKFHAWSLLFWNRYKSQPERRNFEDKMGKADRMLRLSETRDTDSDQYVATSSNVASSSFLKRIRAITTEEKAALLGQDMLVGYEPLPDLTPTQKEEAVRLANAYNALLRYTVEADNVKAKFGASLFFNNKYGQELISVEWDLRYREITDRIPSGYDLEARPTGWIYRTRKKKIADHPTFLRTDLKDCWFDAMIDDPSKWRLFFRRSQISIEEIYTRRDAGEFIRVDEINYSHLYAGEDPSTVERDRKTYADLETGDPVTGLFDRWDVMGIVPINEKGDWDAAKTVPKLHWATWIGKIDASPVCVKLTANPFFHNTLWYQLIHSHEDDCGAFHMGYADLLACNYEEEYTTINQMIDNKTLRNRKPRVMEAGSILTADLMLDGNKIWVKRPGASDPKEVEVQDTTANAIQLLNWLKMDGDEVAATGQAFRGEYAGGRATATEAERVYRQSMKPNLDKAYYVASQMMVFWAEKCMQLWNQYGDPALIFTLTGQSNIVEIKPSDLYRLIRVRIVSAEQFEKMATRRLEENNMLNVVLPPLLQLAPAVAKALIRQTLRNRQYEGVEDWPWDEKVSPEFNAMTIASNESNLMLMSGQDVEPKPEENHEIHEKAHLSMENAYRTLPVEEQNSSYLAIHQRHRAIHKMLWTQLQGAPATTGAAPAPPETPSESPPRMEGEAAGDLMGGTYGGGTAMGGGYG